jgi:hypothetical protein
MYGILAACIAMMAVFLGLFAISVPAPEDDMAFSGVSQIAKIQTVEVLPVANK